jgi:hypothetical protein
MVGDSMFEIWIAGLELIAVARVDGALLISGRPETALWVERRYGRILASLADHGGPPVRIASDRERQLHAASLADPSATAQRAVSLSSSHQEVI